MNCSVFRARHPSLICECNLRWWAVEGERLHTAVITGLATAAHFIKQGRRWSSMAVSESWQSQWQLSERGSEEKLQVPGRRSQRRPAGTPEGPKSSRERFIMGGFIPEWEKNRMWLVASTTWNALASRKRSFSNLKVCHTLQGWDTRDSLMLLLKKTEMNYS